MPECCSASVSSCPLPQPGHASLCPGCGEKSKAVSTLTVKSLVRDHTRVAAAGSYRFCRSQECEVVYFNEGRVFSEGDLKVRVGIKEREDPAPLCYCFDYTRADLRRDIQQSGTTTIPERIKAEVQAGFCACEVKNPSGRCCLGDIYAAIREAKGLRTVAAAEG